jgi:hypothetical protein
MASNLKSTALPSSSPDSYAAVLVCDTCLAAVHQREYASCDFAKSASHNITLKHIEQVERHEGEEAEEERKKGCNYGVKVTLYDPLETRELLTISRYGLEDERWVQKWHEIVDSWKVDEVREK